MPQEPQRHPQRAAAPPGYRSRAPPPNRVPRRPNGPRLPAAPTIGTLDKILVIAAAVAGLVAVGTVVWMFLILNDAIS